MSTDPKDAPGTWRDVGAPLGPIEDLLDVLPPTRTRPEPKDQS